MIEKIPYSQVKEKIENLFVFKTFEPIYPFKKKFQNHIYLPRIVGDEVIDGLYYSIINLLRLTKKRCYFAFRPTEKVSEENDVYIISSETSLMEWIDVVSIQAANGVFLFKGGKSFQMIFDDDENWAIYFDIISFSVMGFDQFERNRVSTCFSKIPESYFFNTLQNYVDRIPQYSKKTQEYWLKIKENYPDS